jgi:hypothetical protein
MDTKSVECLQPCKLQQLSSIFVKASVYTLYNSHETAHFPKGVKIYELKIIM